LRVRHLEVGQKLSAAGHAPILASSHSIEKGGTGFAGTNDLSRRDLDQMRMLLMRYGEAAQLAPFDGAPRARELAKLGESLVQRRRRGCRCAGRQIKRLQSAPSTSKRWSEP